MLSIVIPNYNEPGIKEFRDTCQALYPEAEVIVSTDRWGKGKGWAVRKGLKKATGDIIAIIDGDGDLHPKYIKFLAGFTDYFDIVTGYKVPKSLLTKCSRLLIKVLFGLKDTQTGIKVYQRDSIFDFKTDGFAYDVEMLAKAKKAGKAIGTWKVEASDSKPKSIGVILKTLMDTIKIRLSV